MRLRQIVSNLLSNAIKFTAPSSTIEVAVQGSAESVVISVKDEGPGIAKEDQPKIFNEFETLEQTSRHHQGTGLGLPISIKLAELQGGQIAVASDLGSGAKFTVAIPRQKVMSEECYRKRSSHESFFRTAA
jgi:signal transduction histidine kinase